MANKSSKYQQHSFSTKRSSSSLIKCYERLSQRLILQLVVWSPNHVEHGIALGYF